MCNTSASWRTRSCDCVSQLVSQTWSWDTRDGGEPMVWMPVWKPAGPGLKNFSIQVQVWAHKDPVSLLEGHQVRCVLLSHWKVDPFVLVGSSGGWMGLTHRRANALLYTVTSAVVISSRKDLTDAYRRTVDQISGHPMPHQVHTSINLSHLSCLLRCFAPLLLSHSPERLSPGSAQCLPFHLFSSPLLCILHFYLTSYLFCKKMSHWGWGCRSADRIFA